MYDLDSVFEKFYRTFELARIVKDLGFEDPGILQSMFIFNQPRIGGEVSFHQDQIFLYTESLSMKGFWFALKNSTHENGCLWAIPGAHKNGLKSRFYRKENGEERKWRFLMIQPGIVPNWFLWRKKLEQWCGCTDYYPT